MKKLTKEEVEGINFLTNGRGKGRSKSDVVDRVSLLQVGEGLEVTKQEWADFGYKSDLWNVVASNCYNPRSLINGYLLKIKKTETSWVIIRIA